MAKTTLQRGCFTVAVFTKLFRLLLLLNPLMAPSSYLLIEHPEGFSEFELIRRLKEHCDFIPASFAGDSLSLFRTHFLLFNALYQLQVAWLNDKTGFLKVDAMCIQLIPYHEAEAENFTYLVAAESPQLRDYYLDMHNLTGTDRQDVETLLNTFWKKYTASDKRIDALMVLGLEDPVTMKEITMAYRRKAMLHHPDRGGDGQALQEVNEAMALLKTYYLETSR